MGFKEQVARDLENSFFDNSVFSEMRDVDGKKMHVITDDFELNELGRERSSELFQTYSRLTTVFIPAVEYGARPKLGKSLRIDKKMYTVTEVSEMDGMYEFVLEAVSVGG